MSADTPSTMAVTEQGLRYLVVGSANFVFGFACFAALLLLFDGALDYRIVFCIAWVINVTEAFVTTRLLVFKATGHVLRDYLRFCVVQGSSAVLNLACLTLAVDGLGLNVILAQAIVLPVVVLATFLGHRWFSFHRPHGPRPHLPGHAD